MYVFLYRCNYVLLKNYLLFHWRFGPLQFYFVSRLLMQEQKSVTHGILRAWFPSILKPYLLFVTPFLRARLSQCPPTSTTSLNNSSPQNKSKSNASTKSCYKKAVTSVNNFSSNFWQLLKSWNKVVKSSCQIKQADITYSRHRIEH